MSDRPRVLFVCVKNGGKSQMAAGLMKDLVGDAIDVSSAGTRAGTALYELSVRSLLNRHRLSREGRLLHPQRRAWK